MKFFRIRRRRRVRRVSARSRVEYQALKVRALALVEARLEHRNRHYGFTYNKVFIRNTRSRWGSCSSKRNLGFNYRVATLPAHLLDYIVVHELCHLKEFNHSKAFWGLVGQTVPHWRKLRKELRARPLK